MIKDDPGLEDALDGLYHAHLYALEQDWDELASELFGLYVTVTERSPDEHWDETAEPGESLDLPDLEADEWPKSWDEIYGTPDEDQVYVRRDIYFDMRPTGLRGYDGELYRRVGDDEWIPFEQWIQQLAEEATEDALVESIEVDVEVGAKRGDDA